MRITKREYDNQGGMRNPALYRKQSPNGRWRYYADVNHPAYNKACYRSIYGAPKR